MAKRYTPRGPKAPKRTPTLGPSYFAPVPRVIGDPGIVLTRYGGSHIQGFARKNRLRATKSEVRFHILLQNLGDGALRGKYIFQHAISGKWIVDFFIPEIRLAIEIDGAIHNLPEQLKKDQQKSLDCQKFDITLLRLTNAEVWGDQRSLVDKLRSAWKIARRRENKIIGLAYPNCQNHRSLE